ncbi:mpv17-like protein 2 [Cylas formicarius]|uniref:mpv17-like protein 2 n=1 Tax=Cylas formicarius TaxID=197179 RepID=UPI0029587927|nr:mpv17-like protein 2 [Cylas formicarius]XP_060528563.1 mpv17-like protein 2 [Cylas formicarius]
MQSLLGMPRRALVTTVVRYVSTSKSLQKPFRSIPTLVFGKYLLTTNIVSSGVLMLVGDACQQEIEYRQHKLKERYDLARMTRMFIVGLLLGPIHHYYYLYIAKIMPKRDFTTVVKKIGLDQFMMSPICIATFFYGMGLLEMKTPRNINEEIARKFVDVYVMDWCVWVPTQYVNFYYVPVKYQVLWINAVTMLYNVFLSFIKHKDVEEELTSVVLLESPQVKKTS